jgi:hypothetical protein
MIRKEEGNLGALKFPDSKTTHFTLFLDNAGNLYSFFHDLSKKGVYINIWRARGH